jgi:hypothetical protein
MAKWNKVIVSGSRAHLNDVTASAISPFQVPNITTNGSKRALVVDPVTYQVYLAAADFETGAVQTLNNGQIYVGNASNIATGVTLTGDAQLVGNTGEFRLSGSAIGNQTNLPTVAGTEYALVLDGNNLRKTLVSNIGSRTGSFTGSFTGSIEQSMVLTSAQVWVGNSTNKNQARSLTGDVTISNTGVTTTVIEGQTLYAGGVIPTAVNQIQFLVTSGSNLPDSNKRKYTWGQLTASISASFSTAGLFGTALPSANIFVGNASGQRAAVAMSGDVAINNAGSTTIQTGVVTDTKLATQIVGNFTNFAGTDIADNDVDFYIGSGSTKLNRKLSYGTLKTVLTNQLSAGNSAFRTGSFTGSFTGSIEQSVNLGSNQFWAGNSSGRAQAYNVAGAISWTNISGLFSINPGQVFSASLNTSLVEAYRTGTPYTGILPLPNTSTFLISSGSGGINAGLSYNQLTASISASFAGMGIFTPDPNNVKNNGTGTENAIARFDTGTGKLIKNSGVIIDNSNNVTGINDLTVNNNLFVNGTLTQINTDNLQVEDRFILLNSGSVAADSGFIFQQSTTTGVALGYYESADRFAVQKSLSNTANAFGDPTAYIPTVESGTGNPSSNPQFGGALAVGNLYIDTGGDIWIYS